MQVVTSPNRLLSYSFLVVRLRSLAECALHQSFIYSLYLLCLSIFVGVSLHGYYRLNNQVTQVDPRRFLPITLPPSIPCFSLLHPSPLPFYLVRLCIEPALSRFTLLDSCTATNRSPLLYPYYLPKRLVLGLRTVSATACESCLGKSGGVSWAVRKALSYYLLALLALIVVIAGRSSPVGVGDILLPLGEAERLGMGGRRFWRMDGMDAGLGGGR